MTTLATHPKPSSLNDFTGITYIRGNKPDLINLMTAFSLLVFLAPIKHFTGTVRVNSFEEHTRKRFTIKIGLDSLVNYGSFHFAMHSTIKHGQEYTISHPCDSTVCASTQHFLRKYFASSPKCFLVRLLQKNIS